MATSVRGRWCVFTVAIVVTVSRRCIRHGSRRERTRRRVTGGVMSEPILVARGVQGLQGWPAGGAGAARRRPRSARGVPGAGRAFRQRQDHAAESRGRTGRADIRRSAGARAADRGALRARARGSASALDRVRLPGVQSRAGADGRRERGVRARAPGVGQDRRDRARAVLQDLGLADLADRDPPSCQAVSSSVAVARAIAARPAPSSPTSRPRISMERTPKSSCT